MTDTAVIAQEHEAHIAETKAKLVRDYPDIWGRMLADWRQPPQPAMMWLMYHAHYLFATQGVRWAIDPVRPSHLVAGLPGEAFKELSFLILTHLHSDHMDFPLLATLRDTPVRFVVPEEMLDAVMDEACPGDGQVIVARPDEPIDIEGIKILPFPGLHWEIRPDGQRGGGDGTGYLIEAAGQRWLFPVDVREYSAEKISRWGPVDIIFAHLWLGRGCAMAAAPPLLDEFCRFVLAARPRTVMLGHLYSYQHPHTDLWTRRHAEMARARLIEMAPEVRVIAPQVGEGVSLC